MTPPTYTGIGSRETPGNVLALMTEVAARLCELGWTLRSGGAPGADTAFAAGGGAWSEIYLPWPGFNRTRDWALSTPSPDAFDIAQRFHPAWQHLLRNERAIHARNAHQVLGRFLDSPSAFVLCWTPDGATEKTTARTGGTGQAIRIANGYGVPVFNLRREDHYERAWRLVND